MRLNWMQSLLLASTVTTAACSSPPPPRPDSGVDVPSDMQQPPTDMQQPPTDMQQPPTDMQQPTDVPAPPPDVPAPPPDAPPPPDVPMATARTMPTQGSAAVVSSNDQVMVAVNRTANSVQVFNVGSGGASLSPLGRIALPDAEPWAAVVANDDNAAYVILRKSQQVVRINGLRGAPTLDTARARTGSEPTGIAISPTGRRLYVANWAEGTVTEVDTSTMMVARTIDLNAALASSGMLGTVSARPGLAHPRAIVVTNNGNGDDADETVYVTEFFSQARTSGVPADDSAFDVGRQGVVYRFNAGTGMVGPLITLGPTADTGFRDSVGATSATTGATTGCFPNQLFAAAINNDRVYITGMCSSPRGPTGPATGPAPDNVALANNFKTQLHPTVYVIDTGSNTERDTERVTMTRAWQNLYDTAKPPVPDNASRRFPLIPNDIAFVPRSNIAYITAYGADAVFRLQFQADGTVREVGAAGIPFINLAPASGMPAAGRLPVGIAIMNGATPTHAFVVNANSRNASVVQLSTQSPVAAVATADSPTGIEAEANVGRRFFVTGLGRWSLRGQAWNSCESCHPDGLTDNVTWFFARGPRQTTSLDGSFDRSGNQQRIFNWTGIFDETHDFELNTRGNSGGVGAIVHRNDDGATPPVVSNADRIIFDGTMPVAPQVATATPQAGLNGSTRSLMPDGTTMPRSTLADWSEIDTYVKRIRPPRGLNSLSMDDVTAGRNLFVTNNCAGCHGGPLWTIARRFYVPNEMNNAPAGRLRMTNYVAPAAPFPLALNPPANNMMRTAPLRFTPPADITDPAMRSALIGANDQINCVLRAVGTFPAMLDAMQNGITPIGVRVREVRANMTTPAQGATGFSPPALVGMGTAAPFFHAGNARTLEELFSATFEAHYRALSPNFLQAGDRATQVRQIVAFLLSIDDDTTVISPPTTLGYNPDLCPTSL